MATTWIPSGEAFGIPKLTRTIGVSSIPSAEAFGTAVVFNSSVTTLVAVGIPTGVAFGTPTQAFLPGPVGIPSGAVIPSPLVKSAYTTILCSGTTSGTGILSIPVLLLSGTTAGTATVTGDATLVLLLRGLIQGVGTLGGHFPDPLIGTSLMVGYLWQEQMPEPVCACRTPQPVTQTRCSCGGTLLVQQTSAPCPCSGGGPYRWNEFFPSGTGGLQLFLRNSAGAVMPASVSFTLYWLRNGIPFQAGPANRVPARGPNVGQFYVTGRVGEFGQPGDWLVRWTYQQNFFSPIQEVESRFSVQDAVAAADPRDTTVRILKYGWD